MSANERIFYILLVEDQEEQIEFIQHRFEKQAPKAMLTVARSLAEARARLAAVSPSLLITDLQLPDGLGTELLQQRPIDHPTHQTFPPTDTSLRFPVIVMTGFSDEQAAVEAMKLGAQDYIVKSQKMLEDLPRIAKRVLREWEHIVEQQKAEQELQRTIARSELLYSTARSLIAASELPTKLQIVVDNAAEALPASFVSLTTLDLEEHCIVENLIGGHSVEEYMAPSFDELWNGITGWVLQNQRPILVSKEGTIARNLSNEAADNQLDDELTVEPGPSMIVPLSYQGRKLGVVIARNRPYENDFHQRHLDLFTALASQASSAIETARLMIETNGLLAQTQQQARQLQYVIDAIPVGVLLLDGEQRVVQANATGKFHLQMLSGLQVGDILHELDRQPVQSLLMRHAQSEPAEIIVGGHKFEITVQKIHRRRWILITHQITGDPTMPQLNALAGADREPLFSLRLPLGLLFDS